MKPRKAASARPPFTLRDVVADDLDALAALDRRCFEPGIAFTRAQIASFLALDTLQAVAAESRGRLLGFAIGYLRRPSLAGVLTIDVDAAARRQGVGRALLAELLERLERGGAATVRLEVDVRNAGAIAFYRSFGFRRLGRIADYYGDGRDAYEMERGGAPASTVNAAAHAGSPARPSRRRSTRTGRRSPS